MMDVVPSTDLFWCNHSHGSELDLVIVMSIVTLEIRVSHA